MKLLCLSCGLLFTVSDGVRCCPYCGAKCKHRKKLKQIKLN